MPPTASALRRFVAHDPPCGDGALVCSSGALAGALPAQTSRLREGGGVGSWGLSLEKRGVNLHFLLWGARARIRSAPGREARSCLRAKGTRTSALFIDIVRSLSLLFMAPADGGEHCFFILAF